MESPLFDPGEVETVVLVVSDSLRFDTANEFMPRFRALADDHAEFRACYAAGPHTPSSMSGMMQSRQPIEGGYGTVLPPARPTMAEPIAADGVACGGWHCNPHTIAQRDFDRGFGVYADLITDPPLHRPADEEDGDGTGSKDPKQRIRHSVKRVADRLGVRDVVDRTASLLKTWGLITVDPRVPASRTVEAFGQWLAVTDSRERFAYLHFMDTHMPYKPPDSHWDHSELDRISPGRAEQLYQRLSDEEYDLTAGEIRELRTLYRAEAEYVDRQLDGLVSHLREAGLWESALVIVTSDHGELFGEREAPDGSVTGHPSYLCEEVTHVPLVVAGGPVSDRTDDSLVSGIDLAPTVARAFGTDPPDVWEGTPLGHGSRERVVSSVASPWEGTVDEVDRDCLHVSVRSADRSLLWWVGDYPSEYYRQSGSDRAETGVEDPDPASFESLVETAGAYRDVSFDAVDSTPDDGVAEQRLRNLGYMSD